MLQRTALLLFELVVVTACFGQDKPELGLVLKFDVAPSAAFVQTMENELADILSPDVLRLRWTSADLSSGRETWARAVVVTFHGTCSATPSGPGPEPGELITLAHTAVDGGAILPYTEIDCDRLRSFLGTPRQSGLGRATGRVLAHEIYHVLLQTRGHGKTGIAKAVHSPAALLSRSLRFEDGELKQMRSSFASVRAQIQ